MVSTLARTALRRSRPETPQVQIRRLKRHRALLLAPWAILLAPLAIPLWIWRRSRTKAARSGATRPSRLADGIRVDDIARYLWIGAAAEATAALERIVDDDGAAGKARIEAACRLAERLHFDGAPQAAEAVLARVLGATPDKAASRECRILAAFLALERGDAAQARGHLAAVPDTATDTVAGLLQAATEQDDDARLRATNRVLERHGLAPVRRHVPGRPLSLVNITCDRLPDAPATGHVSVIMPVWNAEATIEASLRSVLSQTYRDLSIIVVDDASTDRSADVAESVAARDPRVRVVRTSVNRGPYAARNRGLAEAEGDFVTTHDADDWSHPERIARQMAILSSHPDVIGVLSDWVRMTADLRVSPGWRLSPDPFALNCSSFLFRSQITDEIGGWDNVRFGADSEFISRCSARYGANAVVTTDPRVPLAFGLESPTSLTRRKDTHVSTFFYGKRQIYAEACSHLHRAGLFGAAAAEAKSRVLPPSYFADGLPDPAPERLVIGDCRNANIVRRMSALLDEASTDDNGAAVQRIGILHRPDFAVEPEARTATEPFCDAWFDLVSRPDVRPAVVEEVDSVPHRVELLPVA